MQIVIEISEPTLAWVSGDTRCLSDEEFREIVYAFQHCIPLPKGHDRLIEVSRDLERKLWEYWKETGIDELPIENATRVLDDAPTIIEADEGGTE